jgi:FAD/FMN-containing dehydrogenase
VGAAHVLEPGPGSHYNRDAANRRGTEGRADAVVLPGDAHEVAGVLRWCYAHDVPLTPRGGGTGLTGGAVALQGGVVCSLERLRRVRELEPGLWRMWPEAGVSTAHVKRLAREHGLMFAPDPGAAEQAQIGGNVATNAGGPHAHKYGPTGAWVTGIEAALAPGELATFGGAARRDVGGYDIKSLLVGSEGTLGVITAVRLRLLPAPEAALPLVIFTRTRAEGCEALMEVLAAGIQPSVLDFLDGRTLALTARSYPGEGAVGTAYAAGPHVGAGEPGAREREGIPAEAGFALLVEVDGSEGEARARRKAVLEATAQAALAVHEPRDAAALWRWRDGINPMVTAARGGKVSEDVVFPLERLREGLERFEQIALRHGMESCVWGHGGDGNAHATVLTDPADEAQLDAAEAVGRELFALAAELGGAVSGEHGVGWSKRGQLARQWGAPALAAHEAIKRALDPKGLLNPAKKLAR